MKKKFAFKLIALALAAATLSSFAACSNGGDTASTHGFHRRYVRRWQHG